MALYNKTKYQNVVISDSIIVGIPKTNSGTSSLVCNTKGLKNLSSQITRLKKNFDKVEEMTNTPYSNFRILEFYIYGNSTRIVYIQDQRGIKIGIDLDFFEDILNELTIVDGTIMNDCVWGTLNSKIILVPVNSEIYKICKENLERKTTRISLKDLEFGDRCIMEDGEELLYIGYYGEYENSSWSDPFALRKLSSSKKHYFKKPSNKTVYSISSPIVSYIKSKNNIDTSGKSILEWVNTLQDRCTKLVPKISKEYTPYLKGVDNYIKDDYDYCFRYNLKINLIDNNSSELITVNTISSSHYGNDYTVKYNNNMYNSLSELLNDNKNLKLAVWFLKILDPETNKELEINITNR